MNVKLNALDLTSFDEKTGEVIDGRPECPFRSLTDNKGYDGVEHVSDMPSETICNGYQSIQQLYERCMRLPPVAGDFECDDGDISDDEAFDELPNEDELEQVSQLYDAMKQGTGIFAPEQSSTSTETQENSPAVDSEEQLDKSE